jgi:hypothetical protein
MTSAPSGSATAAPRRKAARTRTRTPGRPRPRRRPAGRGPSRRPPTGRDLAAWAWLGVLLVVVALVAISSSGDDPDGVPMATAECTLPATGVGLTGEQIANARIIAQVGRDRGLPERAVVIALATAMQESTLRNLDYGDRDSLGLFQQRPSQGWGTPAQVQDPVYAAGKFYDGLVQVPGWEALRLTDAAQVVQRSGFPEAYQQHEGMAVELTTALDLDDLPCG